MIRTTFTAILVVAAIWCAPGFGAPPIAPDPDRAAAGRHVTVDHVARSYRAHGLVVIVGVPNGYAPGGVIYPPVGFQDAHG